MIGVEGQYLLKFRIQDREDFLAPEDLVYFKLFEQAGNVLPSFDLCFTTPDESLLALFHESNDIMVSFGQDRDSMVDVRIVPMRLSPTRTGNMKHMLTATGFYSALEYLNTDRVFISDKKSGIEVIKDVVSRYFIPKFNVAKSTETQNWVQVAQPDRMYINQMWMHSNLTNSFPAVGISSDGQFILKDVKAALKEEFKWRFTLTPSTSKDILYDGSYVPEHNTGFINNWVGYTREKTLYNLEAGTESVLSNTTQPVMALTKDIAKRAEIEKRYAQAGIQSDNVHTEYWQAYLRNLSSLASMGAVRNQVAFDNVFRPIRVLDLVMFKESDTSGIHASEYKSGLYFVTKVARAIQNSKISTVVELSRESMNAVKGEFLPVVPVPAPTVVPLTETEQLVADLKARFPGRYP